MCTVVSKAIQSRRLRSSLVLKRTRHVDAKVSRDCQTEKATARTHLVHTHAARE